MRGRIAAPLLLAALAAGCGGLGSYDYTSADGRYRVQFAGEPKLSEKPVSAPGAVIVVKTAIDADWLGTTRAVMYVDYPDRFMRSGNMDAGLDGACQGMAQQGQFALKSKKPITVFGHPGREVTFDALPGNPEGNLTGKARIFVAGHRLYQVLIAGKSGVIGSDTMEEFLRSFQLTDQASAAPAETQVAVGAPAVAAPSPIIERPAPATAAGREMLAFYEIPDPPSAAIEADVPDDRPSPLLIPAGPDSAPAADPGQSPFRRKGPSPAADPGQSPFRRKGPARPEPAHRPSPPAPGPEEIPTRLTPESGGATILGFAWVGRDDDYTGTDGREIAPGGGKDEHFRLAIDMPPAVIVEEIAILGGPVRWTTRPAVRSWPLAVVSNQQPKNQRQSLRLGAFSGRWNFDLYAESHEALRPGQPLGVEVVLSIQGVRHRLTARCQRN